VLVWQLNEICVSMTGVWYVIFSVCQKSDILLWIHDSSAIFYLVSMANLRNIIVSVWQMSSMWLCQYERLAICDYVNMTLAICDCFGMAAERCVCVSMVVVLYVIVSVWHFREISLCQYDSCANFNYVSMTEEHYLIGSVRELSDFSLCQYDRYATYDCVSMTAERYINMSVWKLSDV
jgi:hypothetical protein